MKGKYWSYRDRKTRKRNFRMLWIARVNAAARAHGLTYSRFMEGIKAAGITSTARCSPTWPSRRTPFSRPSSPRPWTPSG